jgi:hypothetical protein
METLRPISLLELELRRKTKNISMNQCFPVRIAMGISLVKFFCKLHNKPFICEGCGIKLSFNYPDIFCSKCCNECA